MLKTNIDVQAHFKLVARTIDGKERNLTDWFPNLVLNSGLDRMSQGAWFTAIAVGTGNSNPLTTQTGLDAFLASTTTITEANSSRQLNVMPYHYSLVTVFRFAQGTAAGNLSEIAITWGANNCWNRALIKDLNGNPTTITILPNEFLDVYTELRIYPKMTDTVSSVNLLDGKGAVISAHAVTIRPNMNRDLPNSTSTRSGTSAVRLGDAISARLFRVLGDNAQLNNITTSPSGTSIGTTNPASANDSYPTPRSCALKVPLSITQFVGSHKIIDIGSRLGDWKLEYNPPISKDNTQTLEYNFMMTWGRYEPA